MAREVPAVFGSVFHPEMPVLAFENGAWQPTRWQSSSEFTLAPGAHSLHYGSECFEGLKAFRHADDSIHLFRPNMNIARMRQSARLLHLPVPETDAFQAALIELVRRASDIIPDAPASLYLRPTLIGTDPVIGKAATPSANALLYILASPVGDYFKTGAPMKLLVETEHARCAPHMGRIKCGGNYASALAWVLKAKEEHGANQVLFCPNGDVQETAASNFALINGNEIITKPLTSEFLHGVTRDSVLTIANDLGYTISERHSTVTRRGSHPNRHRSRDFARYQLCHRRQRNPRCQHRARHRHPQSRYRHSIWLGRRQIRLVGARVNSIATP